MSADFWGDDLEPQRPGRSATQWREGRRQVFHGSPPRAPPREWASAHRRQDQWGGAQLFTEGEGRDDDSETSYESARRPRSEARDRKKGRKHRYERKERGAKKRRREESSTSSSSVPRPATTQSHNWDAAPVYVDAEAARERAVQQLEAQRTTLAAAIAQRPADVSVTAVAASTERGPLASKVCRELHVGSLPQLGFEAHHLTAFLNEAMEQGGLKICPGDPVVSVRMCGSFAFAEFRSAEECSKALCLNGILPGVACKALTFNRPRLYAQGPTPYTPWPQLMAQRAVEHPELQGRIIGIADGVAPPPGATNAAGGVDPSRPRRKDEKLFVGGLQEPTVLSEDLVDFVNHALTSSGIVQAGGHPPPVLSAKVHSGKYAFLGFRDAQTCSLSLNLNGVQFRGRPLVFSRPRDYDGPATAHITFAEVSAGRPVPPLDAPPPPPQRAAPGGLAPPVIIVGAAPPRAAGVPPNQQRAPPDAAEVETLKEQWCEAKLARDFPTADRIRDLLWASHKVRTQDEWWKLSRPPAAAPGSSNARPAQPAGGRGVYGGPGQAAPPLPPPPPPPPAGPSPSTTAL
eukprot:TRINITY_DN13938_c1_g1_i1.p1 TRINITY_DN13938_c1_g1~~TRINITY_DN13938_c1_g1_i1.p1  ORF type:complete len:574 (+),score=121.62 TRINITY_DN13938_c1_g1_i1:113-1834(+)